MNAILFAQAEKLLGPGFSEPPTGPILAFEIAVLVGAAAMFVVFSFLVRRLWLRFLVTAAAVLTFEIFTAPMWHNARMGPWAYAYRDVSWILTVGWTALILGIVLLVDRLLSRRREPIRYAVSLVLLLPTVVALEWLVVALGIRSYAPEVLERVHPIPGLGVPWEILYYVPVFTGLIVAFYKYWSFAIDGVPLVPVVRRRWLRGIGLAFLAVFLFELMIEPMVVNRGLPAWSYVWHDVSLLMTATWVLIIAAAAVVVGRYLLHLPLVVRFFAAVLIMSCLFLPVESLMIHYGLRVYSESAAANFIGVTTPVTGVAIEVALAIPCYLALIVAFIRYWEIVLDNRL